MKNPKLTFKSSPMRDIETLKAFIVDAGFDGGSNLQWAVFRKYPFLKKYFSGNELNDTRKVELFIRNTYTNDRNVIEKNLKIYEKNWNNIEDKFYELTREIFGSFSWNKGKYIAYSTIWGMYPRFLEDKTFQIPHKRRNKKYVNVIIAHELLHFIFYDYFYLKYPKYKNEKYNFFVWNVSEIFNALIQNSPKWMTVFLLETMTYPEHEKVVKLLAKKYHKKDIFDLDGLIKEIIAKTRNKLVGV